MAVRYSLASLQPPMSNRQTTHIWDVAAAEKEYVGNRKVSYADIAAKYKVGLSAVKRYAALREWPKRRQNATENGLNRHQEHVENNLAEINAQHTQVARNIIAVGNALLIKLSDELKAGRLPDARQVQSIATALDKGIMLERTIVGLPVAIVNHEQPPAQAPKPTAEDADVIMDRMLDHQRRLKVLRGF